MKFLSGLTAILVVGFCHGVESSDALRGKAEEDVPNENGRKLNWWWQVNCRDIRDKQHCYDRHDCDVYYNRRNLGENEEEDEIEDELEDEASTAERELYGWYGWYCDYKRSGNYYWKDCEDIYDKQECSRRDDCEIGYYHRLLKGAFEEKDVEDDLEDDVKASEEAERELYGYYYNQNWYCFCFSLDTTVEVSGKGIVRIDEVKIGDYVKGAKGFTEVYAFGGRNADRNVAFRQLKLESSETLEMSNNHMVFVGPNKTPKIARDVEVGDMLLIMPSMNLSKVIESKVIHKTGFYNPYTKDGTIMVNGILASVHNTEDEDGIPMVVEMFGREVLDMHMLQHIMFAPLRLLCALSPSSFCGESNHDDQDGSHHYVDVVESLQLILTPDFVRGEHYNFLKMNAQLPFRIMFLGAMFSFYGLEILLDNKIAVMAVLSSLLMIMLSYRFGGVSIKAKKGKVKSA